MVLVFFYFILCRRFLDTYLVVIQLLAEHYHFCKQTKKDIMTTKDQLIALINDANIPRFPFAPSDITFGTPIADATSIHNTRIPVSAIPGSGYTGSVDVFYNRIALTDTAISAGLMSEDPITTEAIVAQMNRHPAVVLTEGDMLPFTVPALQIGDIVTVQLQAHDDSLGWMGTAEVPLLFGLPPNSDELFDYMNHVLPRL